MFWKAIHYIISLIYGILFLKTQEYKGDIDLNLRFSPSNLVSVNQSIKFSILQLNKNLSMFDFFSKGNHLAFKYLKDF